MALQTYHPRDIGARCVVTITPRAFRFSVTASNTANLGEIHWMCIHTDPDDRRIVFEPVPGLNKRPGLLKLGTQSGGYRILIAKGLIAQSPWIKSIAAMPVEARRFEMKQYPGPLPPLEHDGSKPRKPAWYIQLMPAFEKSIVPSEIKQLGSNTKGIYRYRGGANGEEVIYIGKGNIRNRFEEEPLREKWNVSRIEYSTIRDNENDQKAYEWEAWWIQRFKKENNGRRPRYNRADGHGDP